MILTPTTLVWVVLGAWLLIRDAARGKGPYRWIRQYRTHNKRLVPGLW